MKLGVFVLVGLVLSMALASGEVQFSCVKKEDCSLLTGNDYDCVNGMCMNGVVESRFLEVDKFISQRDQLGWGVLEVKVVKKSLDRVCLEKGCISFAPVNENLFLDFVRWIFYL
jgi:hypothetical protein